MKEKCIEKYKKAILKYLKKYSGASDNYMVRDLYKYEHILISKFKMSRKEARDIYHEMCEQLYGKEIHDDRSPKKSASKIRSRKPKKVQNVFF